MQFFKNSESELQFACERMSVSKVIEDFCELTTEISRKILIIDTNVSETSLKLYVALMASDCIPLFINESVSDYAFLSILHSLKPDFIATNRKINFSNSYAKMYTVSGMQFYKHIHGIDFSYSTELALLATTSGSTGSPKLVPQTFENIEYNTNQIIGSLALEKKDTALSHLPLSYTFGMSIVNCQIKNHAKIVSCEEGLLLRASLDAISSHNVTFIAGVPLHFEQLIQMRFFKSKYCQSINKILQAGGRLDLNTFHRLQKIMLDTGIEFYSMYGQAEATTRITCGSLCNVRGHSVSVGKPLQNVTVTILDEHGRNCGPEEVGHIMCSGPNICPDYVDKKEDLQFLRQRKNGVLATGDIGYLDALGELYITGRSKRYAKHRGVSVNLDEIEHYLSSKLGLKSAVEVVNEKIVIFIESLESDFVMCELEKALTEISVIEYDLHLCELPRLSNGKIDYKKLTSEARLFDNEID